MSPFCDRKNAPSQRWRCTSLVINWFDTSRLTPLTQDCLFRFRIRYCSPDFISLLPFTRKFWQVIRESNIISQGHTRRCRPCCSCPMGSGSPFVLFWPRLQLMAAIRPCGAMRFLSVTRPTYYYLLSHPPLFSGAFLPSAEGAARKGVAGPPQLTAGKSSPRVWLNLSSLDDRRTIP